MMDQQKIRAAGASVTVGWCLRLLFVLVLFPAALASGIPDSPNAYTWVSSGPVVGSVSAIAIAPSNPAIRYAGILTNSGGFGESSNNGVYKSSDGGLSWSKRLPGKFVSSLAVDPGNANTVYCGTGNGLFKSSDGGVNWSGPYVGATAQVFALLIDPNNVSVIYACVTGNGLYKSVDAGLTWGSISTGLQYYGIHGLAIDPGNTNILYAAAGYASSSAVYKSSNAGGNWTSSGSGLPDSTDNVAAIALSQSSPAILYAGKGNSVYKSTDAGAHWNGTGAGLPASLITSVIVDPGNPSIVLAGTIDKGVFKTTDGGSSWSTTGLAKPGVNTLIFEPGSSNKIYAGTLGDGILKSSDAGQTWTPGSTQPHADVHELAASFPQLQTLYANTADGVYSTTLTNWVNSLPGQLAVSGGVPTHQLVIDPSNPTVLYCATAFTGAFKSTNGGGDWTQIFSVNNNTNINTVALDPSNSQNVFLGTSSARLFKSTNGGGTFNPINSPFNVKLISIDPIASAVMYAGTDFGLAKSTDGGASWVFTSLPHSAIFSLALAPGNAATLYAAVGDGHAYKSTDAGATWNPIFTDVTGTVLTFAFDPGASGTVFAGTDQGVFMSTNGGQSSGNFSNGLPAKAKPVMALSYDPARILYAGTPDGVYTLSLGPVVNEPLSGRVTDITGAGIPGVTLTVSGPPSGQTVSTLTDATGNYSFNNSVGGNTLTPSKPGLVFNPVGWTAVSSSGPVPIDGIHDFIGGAANYTLRGRVIDGFGNPLQFIPVKLTGSQTLGGGTDLNGDFAFFGVFPGGNFTVKPEEPGLAFSPAQVSYTNLPAGDRVVPTFIGTRFPSTLTGQVKDNLGNPMNAVLLTLRRVGGPEGVAVSTNSSGNYSIANIGLLDGAYTLTPTKAGYRFNPPVADPFFQPANFTGTPLPALQFSANNFAVGNGDLSATITVTRSGDLTIPSTVDYATADDTGLQRVHYTLATGTLAFGAGEATKQFSVIVTDGANNSYPANVNLTLANPQGAILGSPASTVLTISQNHIWPGGVNPLDDAQFFVRQHYADFLSRAPDQGGLDYWNGQLTQCGVDQACLRAKRIDISNAFFHELEYQQTGAYVYRVYRVAFGFNQPFPNPDPADPGQARQLPSYAVFAADRARVVGGSSLAQGQADFAKAFVERPEFLAMYPANFGLFFVDAVVGTIRSASGVDLTPQLPALRNLYTQAGGGNSGRAAVLYRLADDSAANPINNQAFINAEYNRAFVATQYFGYLRRDPDMAGFQFWLDQVNGAPLRDVTKQHAMVCSFTTSTEYQQRFSSVVTHNNLECQ